MDDFWDTVHLRDGTFRGNPLVAPAKLVPLADMGAPSGPFPPIRGGRHRNSIKKYT